MGDKNQEKINLHHSQVNQARGKKAQRAFDRRIVFEFNRAGIKARVEASREYVVVCVLVFLAGLMLIVFGLAYLTGAILYG